MPRIDQRFPEEMQKASMSARLWVCAVVGLLVAGHHSKLSADDVTMPRPESATPIRIVAQKAQRWRQGIYEIL
ncbi:MAG: hypothetical protein VB878_09665, partial [Pirellulaceae bacterium]